MRHTRGPAVRRLLLPLLGGLWLASAATVALAGSTSVSEAEQQPPTARSLSRPASDTTSADELPAAAPEDRERVEPPRGIPPPWRESPIPERRPLHPKRHRSWPA